MIAKIPAVTAKPEKYIEWFCVHCGSPIRLDESLAVEGYNCSNSECVNFRRVMLMPISIYRKEIDYREISKKEYDRKYR